MKQNIDLLWDYNYWANHRLLAKARHLSEAQLNEKAPYMWDSLMGTMVHMLGAEWIWRQRLHERVSPAAILAREQFGTLDVLITRWAEEETAMRGYLAGLSDADLERVIDYRNTAGQAFSRPLWKILTHVVNHGTQHRGEVALSLTNFNQSPGDIDITLYLSERGD